MKSGVGWVCGDLPADVAKLWAIVNVSTRSQSDSHVTEQQPCKGGRYNYHPIAEGGGRLEKSTGSRLQISFSALHNHLRMAITFLKNVCKILDLGAKQGPALLARPCKQIWSRKVKLVHSSCDFVFNTDGAKVSSKSSVKIQINTYKRDF